MKIVIVIALLFANACLFSQDSLFRPHPKEQFYPFSEISEKSDSAKYLMQHFYFACRENNIETSSSIKRKADSLFNGNKLQPDPGVWDYNQAYYYRINGQVDKAIERYNKARKHFQSNRYSKALWWAELGLANCDYFLGRRDTAFKKYQLLYDQAIQSGDPLLIGNSAGNVAICYHEFQALSEDSGEKLELENKARHFYKIAIENNSKSKNYLGICHNYGLLGSLNSQTGKKDLASKQLDSALVIGRQHKLDEIVAFMQVNKGYHLTEIGKTKEGIQTIDSALNYFERMEIYNMSSLAVLRKAQAYEKIGDFENALACTKLRADYNKKHYAKTQIEKAAFFETEFKTKELENQALLQNQELEDVKTQKLLLENEQLIWTSWVVILSSILILGLVIFRFAIRNKNRKTALEKQELIMHLQSELIKETIRLQDEVRTKIGREIHDGLCQTITGIKLKQQRLLKDLSTEAPELLKELNENIILTENLYNEARIVSHELAPPAIAHSSMKNLIRDVCHQMSDKIKFTVSDESLSDEIFETDSNKKLQILRILQELTTNIVKHSEASGAQLQAYERNGQLIIRLEDNGVGMPDKIVEGVGIQSVRYRMQMLNGSITFENQNGLNWLLKIPVQKLSSQ